MSFAIIASTFMALTFAAPPEPTPSATPAPTAPAAPLSQAAGEAERGGQTSRGEDAARYAELEQKTPDKVGDFRGGSAVIYVSTGATIVLIVLLILLI